MFKNFKKINLANSSVFWRYAVIAFAFGLIAVFVGQTIFMFVVNRTGQSQVDSPSPLGELAISLDPKKAEQVLAELDARPAKLERLLATSTAMTTASSTLFVDPSL
ncbi:MAG: hypothetical protein WCV68_04320 [Candidatus Paceibacterota bacterium]